MKRALVLSGGGSKGAYSVGAVKALLEDGRTYDVVAGVSVGSLIATYIATQKPEDQLQNFHILESIWLNDVKDDRSVYKPWAPGFLTYIWSLWKGGIYNMRPLRDVLEKNFHISQVKAADVSFYVGVVSLQSGKYRCVRIDPSVMDTQKALNWIWASSIFPILFSAVEIDGEQWVDGGIRNVIPVKDVLENHTDVTHLDVVITSPRRGGVPKVSKLLQSILSVASRGAAILASEVYTSDVASCYYGLKTIYGADVNLVIYDPLEEPNEDSFHFDHEEIKALIEKGYHETKTKLAFESVTLEFEKGY